MISFLLTKDNAQASASTIWNAWNPHGPDVAGTVASKGGRTLSLTGTIMICERLVSEGILVGISQRGYNRRRIMYYRLPASGDESYNDGFLRVAERIKGTPFLLMDSSYGRKAIRDVLLAKVEKDLAIDLGSWKEAAIWAAEHSPTAFMLMCDRDLNAGGLRSIKDKTGRLRGFLKAIGGAISADRASGYRGRLLNEDERTDEVEELLVQGAISAGNEERAALERLERTEG